MRAVAAASLNEVQLVGRLAAPAQERDLPSGDRLCTWRLIVDRPVPDRPVREGSRRPTVDTIDCLVWTASLRRSVGLLTTGDVLHVHGALRRRFWRAGAGAVSRTEVEVTKVRRLSKGTAGAARGSATANS